MRDGLICEAHAAGGDDAYICAGPIELRGMVIDALDQGPIADARIIALDDTGAPMSDVAISHADGNYALPITIARDSDGNPATALTLTLSGSALDYQLYPSGLQPAFPVSTADVMQVEDDPDDETDDHLSFIQNASTTVALIPSTQHGRVHGLRTGRDRGRRSRRDPGRRRGRKRGLHHRRSQRRVHPVQRPDRQQQLAGLSRGPRNHPRDRRCQR